MALTLLEAAKRTPNRLFQGIALSIVTSDDLAAMIPFKTFQGQFITYLREGTIGDTGFIPDDGTMGTPSTGTDDVVAIRARRVGRDLDVDSLAADVGGAQITGAQVMKKCKATWRLVKEKIVSGRNTTSHTLGSTAAPFAAIGAAGVGGIGYGPWLESAPKSGEIRYTHSTTSWAFRAPSDPTFGEEVVATTDGTYTLRSHNRNKYITVTLDVSDATADGRTYIEFASNTDEFDGFNRIMSPDMVIDAASGGDGDEYSLLKLDALMDIEKVRSNRAFVMNGRALMAHFSLLRSLGGTNPDHVKLPGYSESVPTYRGVPLLVNDSIPNNEALGARTDLTSIYLASLDAEEGLFMGVPGTGTETVDVEGDPRTTPVMGWRIESLGALEDKAHRRTRVQWYGALGLRSGLALARACNIVANANG